MLFLSIQKQVYRHKRSSIPSTWVVKGLAKADINIAIHGLKSVVILAVPIAVKSKILAV